MNPARGRLFGALALSPALVAAAGMPARKGLGKRSAAARGLFTTETAPDPASRLALAQPVRRLTDGLVRGGDPASAIHGNFARIIEQNFACAGSAPIARWLDTVEQRSLVTLAQAYINATEMKGRSPLALEILAQRLDAVRLARLAEHFGHARIHAAVLKAAPAKIEGFNARANVNRAGPAPGEMNLHHYEPQAVGAQGRGAGYLPFLDYTIEEIYLSFRTAPLGATSVSASMFQTGLIVGAGLWGSWQAGYMLGGYLTQGLRVYTPSIWNGIVDGVTWWMDRMLEEPLLPPDSYPSPEEQMGRYQKDGFLDIFNLQPALYDGFALEGGDYESAYEWASFVPYEPYPTGPVCNWRDTCGDVNPNRSISGSRRGGKT